MSSNAMLRCTIAVLLACFALHAATIRGVIIDQQSGRPLARTQVQLEIVKGQARGRPAVRTNTNGVFVFEFLPAGSYLLTAVRPEYMPIRYGQKRWNAPGAPIEVTADTDLMLELRMRRLGAISGTVEDENQIGIPDHEVVVFTATRPPRIAGRGRTDDLGIYRVARLTPGMYYARSMPRQLDDSTAVLPTFHREALPVHEAIPVEVNLDETSRETNIRPLFGRLYRLSGRAVSSPPVPVTVRLVSDMGERVASADASGYFRFGELAPGEYEIVAHASDPKDPAGDYLRFHLGGDMDNMLLQLKPFPALRINVGVAGGSGILEQNAVAVMARRKDLSGAGQPQPLSGLRSQLMPGRWEFMVRTSAQYCPLQLHTRRSYGRGDTWVEATLDAGYQMLDVTLSARPAGVSGRVLDSRNEPVAGVPVYLEPYERENRRRAGEVRTARTDGQGVYRFEGLPPGHYRAVGTYDFDEPGEETMETVRPAAVTVKEGERAALDLKLHVME